MTKQSESEKLTDAEQEIVDAVAKTKGRTLTPQETRLALEQARHLGEL